MPYSSDVGWWIPGLTYVHYYPNLSSNERKKYQMELETIENGISYYLKDYSPRKTKSGGLRCLSRHGRPPARLVTRPLKETYFVDVRR